MKIIIKSIVLLIAILLPSISNAEFLNCGVHSIVTTWIQGDRDDNSDHANNVIVHIDRAPCNGSNLVYRET